MKYRIKIIEILPPVEQTSSYEKSKDIYEQTVESLDVLSVIKAVNGIKIESTG